MFDLTVFSRWAVLLGAVSLSTAGSAQTRADQLGLQDPLLRAWYNTSLQDRMLDVPDTIVLFYKLYDIRPIVSFSYWLGQMGEGRERVGLHVSDSQAQDLQKIYQSPEARAAMDSSSGVALDASLEGALAILQNLAQSESADNAMIEGLQQAERGIYRVKSYARFVQAVEQVGQRSPDLAKALIQNLSRFMTLEEGEFFLSTRPHIVAARSLCEAIHDRWQRERRQVLRQADARDMAEIIRSTPDFPGFYTTFIELTSLRYVSLADFDVSVNQIFAQAVTEKVDELFHHDAPNAHVQKILDIFAEEIKRIGETIPKVEISGGQSIPGLEVVLTARDTVVAYGKAEREGHVRLKIDLSELRNDQQNFPLSVERTIHVPSGADATSVADAIDNLMDEHNVITNQYRDWWGGHAIRIHHSHSNSDPFSFSKLSEAAESRDFAERWQSLFFTGESQRPFNWRSFIPTEVVVERESLPVEDSRDPDYKDVMVLKGKLGDMTLTIENLASYGWNRSVSAEDREYYLETSQDRNGEILVSGQDAEGRTVIHQRSISNEEVSELKHAVGVVSDWSNATFSIAKQGILQTPALEIGEGHGHWF